MLASKKRRRSESDDVKSPKRIKISTISDATQLIYESIEEFFKSEKGLKYNDSNVNISQIIAEYATPSKICSLCKNILSQRREDATPLFTCYDQDCGCDRYVCEKCLYKCQVCITCWGLFCPDYLNIKCYDCSEMVCDNCGKECDKCREMYCRECMKCCVVCNVLNCDDCMDSWECDCGATYCDDCAKRRDDCAICGDMDYWPYLL